MACDLNSLECKTSTAIGPCGYVGEDCCPGSDEWAYPVCYGTFATCMALNHMNQTYYQCECEEGHTKCGSECCGNNQTCFYDALHGEEYCDTFCSGSYQPCSSDAACCAGLQCQSGICVPTTACGAADQNCCNTGIPCNDGLICAAGTCIQCTDNDGDGYCLEQVLDMPPDCNDFDPLVHPYAMEICNGNDEDCDGLIDNDPSGQCCHYKVDCSDGDPGTFDSCYRGICYYCTSGSCQHDCLPQGWFCVNDGECCSELCVNHSCS